MERYSTEETLILVKHQVAAMMKTIWGSKEVGKDPKLKVRKKIENSKETVIEMSWKRDPDKACKW